MPFHRRNTRRSRPRRRRRARPRRRMRRRRAVLDPERKFTEVFPAVLSVSSAGTVSIVNGVPEGTAPINRIGMQMLNLSSLITYSWTINGTNNAAVVVRCALVLYKQPRLLTLDIADIWTRIGTADAAISPRVLVDALQYKVLWTRTHTLNFAKQQVTRTMMNNRRFKVRFSGTGGAASDVFTGSLWFIAVSDTAVAGSLPSLKFHSRTRFVG